MTLDDYHSRLYVWGLNLVWDDNWTFSEIWDYAGWLWARRGLFWFVLRLVAGDTLGCLGIRPRRYLRALKLVVSDHWSCLRRRPRRYLHWSCLGSHPRRYLRFLDLYFWIFSVGNNGEGFSF